MTEQIFFNVPLEKLKPVFKEWMKEVLSETKQEPQENSPELLTRKQVSEILGISLVTLNEWTKKGIIPALKIGTRVRYEKDAVYAALNKVETLKYRRG